MLFSPLSVKSLAENGNVSKLAVFGKFCLKYAMNLIKLAVFGKFLIKEFDKTCRFRQVLV